MADTPQPLPDADPEAAAQAKADRRERDRQQLLQDIATSTTDDVRAQVGYILNHFPETRDSDILLARQLWETFYAEWVDGGTVRLEDLHELPTQTHITRTRATIQNTYGLFQPRTAVAQFRRGRREDTTREMGADRPGPGLPILSVHADESGKTQRYLVVGSLWAVDPVREWRVAQALRDWKDRAGVRGEFKFADLTRDRLPLAIQYVEQALQYSDVIGLKACVLDRTTVQGRPVEDVLARLYHELAVAGLTHEVDAGRVTLPRAVYLVKDADDGPDALLLPELTRRLTATCRAQFGEDVQVDSVVTANSAASPLLQLADLFSGSVARRYNTPGHGDDTQPKDVMAAFFEQVAGCALAAPDPKPVGDFVYLHRL